MRSMGFGGAGRGSVACSSDPGESAQRIERAPSPSPPQGVAHPEREPIAQEKQSMDARGGECLFIGANIW